MPANEVLVLVDAETSLRLLPAMRGVGEDLGREWVNVHLAQLGVFEDVVV